MPIRRKSQKILGVPVTSDLISFLAYVPDNSVTLTYSPNRRDNDQFKENPLYVNENLSSLHEEKFYTELNLQQVHFSIALLFCFCL